MVLGIRPDVIRASLIIRQLKEQLGDQFEFVWSGQHYSDNMKDIFFRQLEVPAPDVTLQLDTTSDQSMIGSLISSLGDYLDSAKPDAVVFLGDTNTVTGSIAVAAKNIPIVHIEGCMRSYDWRMPEEKFRTAIDHLADVIYAYVDEYKQQGVIEGLDPDNIIVTGNPIVDVLQHYFQSGKVRLSKDGREALLSSYGVEGGEIWSMTCHRRENVDSALSLKRILDLAGSCPGTVVFPAGYRTQARIREYQLELPSNVRLIDPVGYAELMELIDSSTAVLTDSGTIVEEAAVLGVPSVQMRTSTERPQVYDCGGSVKFDPHTEYSPAELSAIVKSATDRRSTTWAHTLGDGLASQRIADDLVVRFKSGNWSGHKPNPDLRPIARNYGFGLGNLGRP
jgi:UDP-N-acetylglucosamine 2-epimerase (non-hydrolysing)